MKREDIVTEAREWQGVPFLHQGRSRSGVDCVGLVQKVGDRFSVHYVDLMGYARAPANLTFLRHLRQFLKPYPIKGIRTGIVGVFRQSRFPCHIGIFSVKDNVPSLIHSRADRHKVVEEPYDPEMFHLVELLAFPGLED